MRILLINHYAGSDFHGMEFRPFHMAHQWVKSGHDVTIMAGSFSHLRNRNPIVEGHAAEELLAGVRYRWLKTRRYQGNGVGRMLSIFDFIRRLSRERRGFLRTWIPDAVIASSTYPFDIYQARSIARFAQARLIWEVHDLWPLSPMLLGGYSKWHPFILATQYAEDACCRSADAVVSILPRADRHLVTRGLAPKKYFAVPNGINCDIDEREIPAFQTAFAALITDLHRRGFFVIGYAGSHTDSNSISTLLNACGPQELEGVACVLMGDGPGKPDLRNQAKRLGIAECHFLPRAPRHEAICFLKQCDAIYLGLRDDPLYKFGIGMNKIFDAMLCARPVLASYTACNDPIGDAACGITLPAEDAPALTAAINTLRSMSIDERDAMGANGGTYVRRHHDYRQLAWQFAQIIETTVRGSR